MAEKEFGEFGECRQSRWRKAKFPTVSTTLTPPVLTPAERAKRYRETLKKYPKKLLEFRQKEKDRKQQQRKRMTEEQKTQYRIKAKERQQRFRDRRKMMGIKPPGKPSEQKVQTRSEKEKQREYWRRKKAESRSRQSSQKHRRYKEWDRSYRRDIRSESQAVKRLRGTKSLPKDPEKFVIAVENFIQKATPKKIELLKQKQLLNTPKSKKKLSFYEHSSQVLKESFPARRSDNKKTIIKNLACLKKYRLSRTLAKFLGVSDSCVSKHLSSAEKPKQPRKVATSISDKSTIKNFFQRVDVSTSLPTAKRIKKDSNERRVVAKPLRDTYQDFKQQHSDVTASFSTFIRNKPKNVESTRKQPWFGCLCESCANVDLKLKALSQVAARCRSDVKLKDKYEAVKITVCEKEEGAAFHKLNCIKRKCNSCGVDSLVRFYQPLAVAAPMATGTVVYSKWERVKKIYKGKEVTQIMPVTHTETITEVILNLAQEVETLAEHLFVASWQQKQFTNLQHNIPQSWVVLNMDFAENYACIAQKEVQGAHWSHNQVTVHPTVAYYRCPVEGCKDTVMEHLIFISEDLTHDAAAVQEFVKIANNHLIEVRGLKIEKEIQMTDGCAAQYKSRIPFTDISFCQTDFGFSVERHFYGSRHGKGPSDGAGAVVKSSVRRAVNGEKVIVNNSKDFFECAKKMTKEDEGHKEHFRRTIFHVAAMNHNRPERSNQCRTLKGTRKIQAIKAVDQMIIQTRNLSCFCEGCINGDSQACVNRDYVFEWELQDIKKAERPVLTARNVGAERGRRRVNAQRGVRQRGQGRGVRRQRGQGRGGLQRGNRRGNTQRGNARGGAQRGGRTGVRQRGQCRGARQRGQGRREKRGRKRKRSDTEFSSSDSESDIALSDLEDDVTDEDSRSAVIPRAGISDLEDDVTDEDSRSAVIPRAGVSDIEDNVTDEDSRSAVIPRAGVSDMEDNVTDEDSRSRRYAVIPRTRGGLKTRGGVRTRGGTRNSTPNACASQSLFALPLDCEVGTSTDFNMFALPLSGCEVGSSTDFQTMDNTDFQTMDITALLEVIDRSMSGSIETMQQPQMVETRQQPHYVEIQQLPFSVQTEQSPSVEVLLQLPNIETEGTPSVSTVQQPSVVSMQPPSVETVQLSGVEIMQPHSVESVQPPNVKNAQLPIVKSVQPPIIESIQPPSVKSVQPPSVESLQPHSVGSVQPSIFKFGQSHSVKSVQPPSVESVQPPSVKFLQSPSVKSIQQPIVESVQPPSVESMRPPGVESVHPTSVETVESVQPPCVKSVLPPSFESVQPPSVESVQPPSVQTQKQMSSRGDLMQTPGVESVQPPSEESVQPPSVESMWPPSVESVKPTSVESVQPPSVESLQPPSVQTQKQVSSRGDLMQTPGVESVQPPSEESVQPPSVESMRPPSVESVQPTCVESVQLPSVESLQPPSVQTQKQVSSRGDLMQTAGVESVQPSSVESVLPPSVESVQPTSVESVKPPSVESLQPPSVQTQKQVSSRGDLMQTPGVESVQPPSVESVQPPFVESMWPPSVESVQPTSVESVQPPSVESVRPPSVQTQKQMSSRGDSMQTPSVESVQPPNVESMQPPSVESMQPHCVESVQPTSVESVQPTSVESVQPPSVESLQPRNAETQWQLSSRYQSGMFILVKHGKSFLPAVVDDWPWIKYFSKKSNVLWTLNDMKYTVALSDVVKQMAVPEMSVVGRAGCRLYYKFQPEDLKQ